MFHVLLSIMLVFLIIIYSERRGKLLLLVETEAHEEREAQKKNLHKHLLENYFIFFFMYTKRNEKDSTSFHAYNSRLIIYIEIYKCAFLLNIFFFFAFCLLPACLVVYINFSHLRLEKQENSIFFCCVIFVPFFYNMNT